MTDPSSNQHKGVILKEAREARQIPLETVHEATKIPMDALRAIEEGYTVRSLSPFYYKGFIKMYAQYLGVDARELLEDPQPKREERQQDAEQEPEEPVKTKPEVKLKFNFDKDELLHKVKEFFTEKRIKQIVAILGVLLALFLLVKAVGAVKNFFTRSPKQKVVKVRKQRVKAAPVKKVAKPAAKPVAKAAPAPNPKPKPAPVMKLANRTIPVPAADKVSLTIRAKRSTWLQVKTDGMVVFQSTLNKGAVESWNADDKIEVSGKNVNELELELNGRVIGSLGRADSHARKLIITKRGLTVKK